jgi:UDP-glucose 4-epimerase
MRVLITGGAGFIGSHLAERYLLDGHEVFILDNFSTGSQTNIDSLPKNPKLHVIKNSVLDYDVSLELVGTCDVVFHLAAAVGVKYIIDNPLESLETNTRGTEVILQLCDKFKKKVLITSTSEVYGKNENVPLKEEYDRVVGSTTIARWSYSCSKAFDEFLALAYHRTKGLPIVLVRLFNTVGPRQTGRYGMVIPRFVQAALDNEPILVHGDGQQTRAFGYVKDVVRALVDLVENPAAIGEIFNIGGQEEISMMQLAKRVKNLTASKSEIKTIPYEEAYEKGFEDMRRRVPDCSKLEKTLGYRPNTSLDDILKKVISFYQSLK